MSESENLIQEAIKGWNADRCLWARGLLPERLGSALPQVGWNEVKTWAVGDFADVVSRGGTVYSDGAGPRGRTFRPGSRVHSGAVAVIPCSDGDASYVKEYAAVCGQVPGRQTVPRAEVWALILAVSHSPPHPELEIGGDRR